MRLPLTPALLVLALAASSPAQSTDWTGAVSSDWSVTGNWTAGVPDSVSDALVPATATTFPDTTGVADPACLDLTVESGATLTLGSDLEVHGDLAAFGSVDGAAAVRMVGTGDLGDAVIATSVPRVVVDTAATISVPGTFSTDDDLDLDGGILSVTGTLTVKRDLQVDAGLLSGSGTVSIERDLTLNGGSITAAVSVDGDLDVAGGVLAVAGTVPVGGDLALIAGTLSGSGTVDVAGAVTHTATGVASPPDLEVGGNWTSGAAFVPGTGRVTFDGSSPTLIVIDSIFVDVSLGAGTTADLGRGTLLLKGDLSYDATAGFTAGSTVGLVGASQTLSTVGPLPDVLVASAGTVTLSAAQAIDIDGDLTLVAGTLSLSAGADVSLAGGLTLAGGMLLADGAGAEIDVEGPVSITGGSHSTPPDLRCAGSWTSGPHFHATSGEVVFDAAGTTQTATLAGTGFFDLTVDDGVTLDVVDDDLAVAGALTLGNGSAITATSVVAFEGADQTLSVSGALPNVSVDVSGTLTVSSSALEITEGLGLLGGTLLLDTATTLTVSGPAFFSAGSLVGIDATSVLALDDEVVFAGTTATTPPDIEWSGDSWISDSGFAATSGKVTMNGTVQELSPPGTTFFDVTLTNGTFVDVVAVPQAVAGTLLIIPPASYSTESIINFVGLDQVVDPIGHLPNAQITTAGNVILADGLVVDGDLDVVLGKMCLDESSEAVVLGESRFTGGELGSDDPMSVLNLDGPVSFTGTDVIDPPILEVAGAWTSNGSFTPNDNTVVFDGGAGQSVSAAGSTFFGVDIDAGTTVDVTSPDLTLQGDITVDGAFTPGDTVRLVGTAQGVSPGGALPNVIVDSTGTVSFDDTLVVIAGNLDHDGGELRLTTGTTLRVDGDALLDAGTLAADAATARLDIEGDTVIDGTTTTAPPFITAAGDWSSNATFSPPSNTVELDGSGTTQLLGLAPDFGPTFFEVIIRNGTRVIGNDLDLNADTIRVAASGSLDLNGQRMAIPGTDVDISGALIVSADAELALGGGVDMLVGITGALTVVGLPGQPARVTGDAGGGYDLIIDGTLAACDFVMQEMGPLGIRVTLGATLADPPNDLRNGLFDLGSAGKNTVLLDMQRPAPTSFSAITFENTGGQADFNVRSLLGAPITFLNSLGAFTGEAFDDDPLEPGGDQILFVNASTQLLSGPDPVSLPGVIRVQWASLQEIDTEAFLVEASLNAGPFQVVGEVEPTGSLSAYQFDHFAPIPGGQYCYRLSERILHTGQINLLAFGGCAIGIPGNDPPNLLTVSPLGLIPDLGMALNLATLLPLPGVVIRVSGGTYPPFSLNGLLPGLFNKHIVIAALGNGPVIIDASSGPIVIHDTTPLTAVSLDDIDVVATGNAAVIVTSCTGIVVLDGVDAVTDPVFPALRITDSTRTVVQKATLAGGPDLLVEGDSHALVSRTSAPAVAVNDTALMRSVQLQGVVTPAAGATWVDHAGAMPRIEVPPFAALGDPLLPIELQGEPSTLALLFLDLGLTWIDFYPAANKQMVLFMTGLTPPALVPILPTGTTPFFAGVPADPSLLGLTLHLQLVGTSSGGGPTQLRFGHVKPLTFVPPGPP